MMPRTVCLIGPGHVASNPRLVKEADALHAAGVRVRVVAGTSHPLVEPLDAALLASRPWAAVRVPLGSKWARAPRKLRRRVAETLAFGGWRRSPGTVAWAESELAGRLAAAAAAEPADLYIGHYLPGLYAARAAARRHGTAYGFDIEDDHVAELDDTPANAGKRAAREAFERTLLPGAAHVTASSPQIAAVYRARYGIDPRTVLNVFPLTDAPAEPADTAHLRGEGPAALYWFSQTVGAGRGLEEVVAALGRMTVPAVLHLRGIPAAGYREHLEARTATGRIVWLPPAPPDDMVRLCAGYDLGLALEMTAPPNRAICLTNKAFTYVLAGLPVVLSRTPAQDWLAGELGAAGLSVDLADPAGLAAALDAALADRAGLSARRAAAWRVGRERFHWGAESEEFLACLRGPRPAAAFAGRAAEPANS